MDKIPEWLAPYADQIEGDGGITLSASPWMKVFPESPVRWTFQFSSAVDYRACGEMVYKRVMERSGDTIMVVEVSARLGIIDLYRSARSASSEFGLMEASKLIAAELLNTYAKSKPAA